MQDSDPWRQYEEHQHEEWIQEWIADYERAENEPLRKYGKTGNSTSKSADRTKESPAR